MQNELQAAIGRNLDKVNERIHLAAKRAGREPSSIELVAVTKKKSAAVVKALLENGVHKIGESYLNEALFKIDLLKDFAVEWHMIGNIQPGKEKQITRAFQVVHSVGKLDTAAALNEHAAADGKQIPVYLELNVSGEKTKHGWLAAQENHWPAMLSEFESLLEMPALRVVGLMTMAPFSENPEDARPYFKLMRRIREYISRQIPGSEIDGLSMGMSGDFEVAVEEGATILRIGSALVGPRN